MGYAILQFIVIFALLLALAIPLGRYLYVVFFKETSKLDRFFLPIEKIIYRASGIKNLEETGWKKYSFAFLSVNAVLLGISYLIVRMQKYLPFNSAKIDNMEPTLAFNTVISFMTNTNLQHYSGETGLSILSQMIFITMMMFTSAATGIAVAMAVIRALSTKGKVIGNFYQDFIRANVRVLLPLAVVVTLFLVALGVPQTFASSATVTTLEGKVQTLALGPVASLESIKHLGTNGGGFFGANSAHPFENPNPLTSVIEILSMWCIPAAIPFTYGLAVKNRKQGWVLFTTMFAIFLVMLSVVYSAEQAGNPMLNKLGFSSSQGSMEGKEVRFGIPLSSLFTTVTTAATTGTVNNMHDTLTPIGGLVPLSQMMLNNVFGGDGVGFVNMLMYAILAVFLAGLMVGRTPEFLGRKIEPREIKLIVIALLTHPFIILVPSAIAFMTHLGTDAISNPGFHGISQVVYEYTSSAANNGSGFEGLGDNTPFWNISTGMVMLLGRYISIIAMLAVAGSLVQKQPVPETVGTFRTDNVTFGVILIGTVLVIGALTFFPVLVLGPIAEFLTIR
ncbi:MULTISPECIES: potassium-transporting ATPase subunit KdpA [unclassified Geobacillus]|uniref:potassium-transporting ATPase subunit KdpA n=1 Tax=unclassified Geobacillus TaxID=2642459 RepID=UPI000BE33FD2|nr:MULTISPECIES: potassium-transporting ATPase subunit KdpA [unclassified Geobacillus]PDM38950.1 potassium-transporting ATPase subunit KdpA [Parageobacillus yumthangensis]PUF86849.1 potassium-transporting ATPase subunit KdpA [Geobacillus sp. LYN3]RDV23286.1 potassium-transporting ATPase subunit KdpA [Parageobacillus toebii]TXK86925.1 potassium-transporting ATPase subunit KdpA [Geobacillus sp. AYS3]